MTRVHHRIVVGVVVMSIALSSFSHAASRSTDPARTMFLTFGVSVALPGVTLPSGTYVFELADPSHARELVRVSSQDRRRIYLTAFTRVVTRPPTIAGGELISFGEPHDDAAMPIATWWPAGESSGRQFVYGR